MSEQAVAEYALALRGRYQGGGRKEKGRILDEFCATTGMHRIAHSGVTNRVRTRFFAHARSSGAWRRRSPGCLRTIAS